MNTSGTPEFAFPDRVSDRSLDLMALGSLVMERIIHVERWPEPGGQDVVPVMWLADTSGGCAMNVSTFTARLGGRAAIISTIGGGRYAKTVWDELLESGVHTDYLVRRLGRDGSLIIILTDPSGDWAVLDHIDPELCLDTKDLPPEVAFGEAKVLHVDGFSFISVGDKEAVLEAVKRGRRAGCLLSVDGSVPAAKTEPEFLRRLFAQADIVFANQTEALAVTGAADTLGAIEALQLMGPAVSILKLGSDGSVVITPEATASIAHYKVKVVDTVAAGDAYIAATLLSLSQGHPLIEAANRGSAAGALACLGPGSLSSRFNMKDVLATIAGNAAQVDGSA